MQGGDQIFSSKLELINLNELATPRTDRVTNLANITRREKIQV